MGDEFEDRDPLGPVSAADSEPQAEYDVGYRKPPRHSRFPNGRSGNPNGRPKEIINLVACIRRNARRDRCDRERRPGDVEERGDDAHARRSGPQMRSEGFHEVPGLAQASRPCSNLPSLIRKSRLVLAGQDSTTSTRSRRTSESRCRLRRSTSCLTRSTRNPIAGERP